jgi:DNA-binding NtrC family response regulator
MKKLSPQKMAKLKADYEKCIQALISADFNREDAAKSLDITRKTLYNKFKRFKEAGLHKTSKVA